MEQMIFISKDEVLSFNGKSVEFLIQTEADPIHGRGTLVATRSGFREGMGYLAIDLSHQTLQGHYVSDQIELNQNQKDRLERHPNAEKFHFRLIEAHGIHSHPDIASILLSMGLDKDKFHLPDEQAADPSTS